MSSYPENDRIMPKMQLAGKEIVEKELSILREILSALVHEEDAILRNQGVSILEQNALRDSMFKRLNALEVERKALAPHFTLDDETFLSEKYSALMKKIQMQLESNKHLFFSPRPMKQATSVSKNRIVTLEKKQ